MNQIATAAEPRLSYLCDPLALAAVARNGFDEQPWLLPGGRGRCLEEHDHVVLAADAVSGRPLAVLGADDGATPSESILFLRTAGHADMPRGARLLRRMAALLLLRVAGQQSLPRVLAARADDLVCQSLLIDLADRLRGGSLFSGPEAAVIPLHAAAAARRIARCMAGGRRLASAAGRFMLEAEICLEARPLGSDARRVSSGSGAAPIGPLPAVLDLRASAEDALLDDARRIYRAR